MRSSGEARESRDQLGDEEGMATREILAPCVLLPLSMVSVRQPLLPYVVIHIYSQSRVSTSPPSFSCQINKRYL